MELEKKSTIITGAGKEVKKPDQSISWSDILTKPITNIPTVNNPQTIQPDKPQETIETAPVAETVFEPEIQFNNLKSDLPQKTALDDLLKQSVKDTLYISPSGIKLDSREAKLCAYYCLGDTEGNKRQSYIKAYQKSQTDVFNSNRAFKKERIQARIAEIRLGLLETAELSPDVASKAEVLKSLTAISRGDLTKFARWGSVKTQDLIKLAIEQMREAGENNEELDLDLLVDTLKRSLDPFTDYMEFLPSDQVDGRLVKTIKKTRNGVQIQLHDPLKAHELLAKYYGLVGDGDESGRTNTNEPLSLQDIEKLQDVIGAETRMIRQLMAIPESIPAVERAD